MSFDHQPQLVGTIHKWLGWNEEHGRISLYSFSRLEGGRATNKGLLFENGASFFFSSHSSELIKKIISGIRADPLMFSSLYISDIVIQEDPDLSDQELFYVASPILIKRRAGDKIKHIIFNDPLSAECLMDTCRTKMKEAGISDDSLAIHFNLDFHTAKTQMINYKGIENRANWCPVIIKAKPETKVFLWNVGLGNSTGIGFGAIK